MTFSVSKRTSGQADTLIVVRSYYVYVIELVGLPKLSVYIGQSALTPEKRFLKHMNGKKQAGSKYVRKYGSRLVPHLYEHENPLETRGEARDAEQRIRRALERRGITVYGACTIGRDRGCRL